MTQRRRKNTTPTGLIPEDALERAPEPVAQAQAAALAATAARAEAGSRVAKAREAAGAAPDADAAALAETARKGTKPPKSSAPLLAEEATAARAAYDLLGGDVTQAVEQLHKAVIKHQRECIAAQRPVVAEQVAEAIGLAEQLAVVLEEAAAEDSVLGGYYSADAFQPHPRRGRRPTEVGRLSFVKPRTPAVEARAALKALTSALGGFAREDVTAGERQDIEQIEREARPQQPGLGRGVYVGQ